MAEKYYGISPYAYCAGNPVNLVDPTGEESKPLFVQVAPVLYEVFKTIVIATAAYWGAKSVSQAIEKGDSEEYSYNPGWGWQEKRDHESRDETERIKLKHRESMNNSMGDPENHDDNNNFKYRGGPRSLGTALLLLAFSQTEPGQMILSFIRDWLHSDNSVDNENASPASINNPVEPKDNNFAEYLERIKKERIR